MARILHLLKAGDTTLPAIAIRRSLEAGDEVELALLEGATPGPFPDGVRVRRVPDDLSWGELLEAIFAADHVITW